MYIPRNGKEETTPFLPRDELYVTSHEVRYIPREAGEEISPLLAQRGTICNRPDTFPERDRSR